MTDTEIIKTLECCIKPNCNDCLLKKRVLCVHELKENALNLINRQKAEVERLKGEIGSLNKKYPCTVDVGNNCLVYARSFDDYDKLIGDISAEAVKEFAERLKEKFRIKYSHSKSCEELIDNLLKEMENEIK